MTAQPGYKTVATPEPTTAEAELVTRAKLGEEAAIRELIRRMNPRLFRIARGIVFTDADAEEVVQESYLKAFTHLDTFRAEARFSTWIIRIAINTARMRLRSARPQEEYDTVTEPRNATESVLAFPGQETNMPEAALGRTQIRALLESTVAQLPSDLRLPFLMREAENMSVRAIARHLSLNPITVKTRLFRARRRLRTTLEERIHGGFDAIFPFDGARCAGMADRVVAGLNRS
ncbi:RNA polymerase sigma factor [Sulfitobacter sp. S0837]|uniref:RNA polymerase sigma factor n=1 Tax=Sulfitobacter maritimus TaxID=2741719 RepID=UPI001581B476|nr:RNA polymerase sigma factor [Sulfitobacter maritimus]